MKFSITPITGQELFDLYELYRKAGGPDSPKDKLSSLSKAACEIAVSRFDKEKHFSIHFENEHIGFIGIYPNSSYANLFYIFSEEQRGKGYLILLLEDIKEYCLKNYETISTLIAVTRPDNIPSVRGLEKFGFQNDGEYSEDEVLYVEYSYLLK